MRSPNQNKQRNIGIAQLLGVFSPAKGVTEHIHKNQVALALGSASHHAHEMPFF
jgi:hypothetical protein